MLAGAEEAVQAGSEATGEEGMTAAPRTSWVTSANDPASDFPLQNLPYGVFRHDGTTCVGVAIGDQILDLHACAHLGLLAGLPGEIAAACSAVRMNSLMSLGSTSWSALRRELTSLLDVDQPDPTSVAQLLVPMREVEMQLPAAIGDYTDFYASIHHATRVGKLFRPDNPLLPNYKYVPIGYHGRASSIVVSGAEITRPSGQTKPTASDPVFGPTQSLDYELEVGLFIGPGNHLGEPIPIASAEQHLFGLCLLNDWSARDIQSWEAQPLGPFLAKSFATTISPWIVTLEALDPYRIPTPKRSPHDPAPLPYLASAADAIDLTLEVYLQSSVMRHAGAAPMQLSTSNLSDLYWTPAQLITHHTSNGCNLRPGDLLATGTISGPEEGSEGCLLEKKLNPHPIQLPSGEQRVFLEDGDQVTFRAFTQKTGLPRIGFGECTGIVVG
jgi:fumarylacetoacetase